MLKMIIIFGSTGDLAKKKLIPALNKLFTRGVKIPVLVVGRRDFTKKDYIKFIGQKLDPGFVKKIDYFMTDFSDNGEEFNAKVASYKTDGRIYYLSTPPSLFTEITSYLKDSGVLELEGYNRVAYEKPFGYNSRSAKELNQHVTSVFKEKEIYRIDHYLGKELVNNILAFKFSNQIFHGIWNNEFIEKVNITISESVGVGTRGGYYDKSGAIRDVLQNHALQLIALLAMKEPKNMNADSIRDKKAQALSKLKAPYKVKVGQYSGDDKINSYIEDIGADSKTETFVSTDIYLNTKEWEGVPFKVSTGKKMKDSFAKIEIILKRTKCKLFECKEPNKIVIDIQPREHIHIKFNSINPKTDELIDESMEFCHACKYSMYSLEAYERIFQGIISGDQTLFTRFDEVSYSWRYVDKLERLKARKKLILYKPGSNINDLI